MTFQKKLLEWYHKYKRDLPWRRTRDPYAIWVSEIMLQQTQVATVIPYYQRFLKKFPNLKSLAKADEAKVLALWSGLGYYRRAKFLHRGARYVLEKLSGQIPPHPEGLRHIPGIGAYTAGAIASIAFGFPAPLVDGNVIRVYARLFAKRGHRKDPELARQIWALAAEHLEPKSSGDFNQALMELGATVCRSALPNCGSCPIRGHCAALKTGQPEDFPEPTPPEQTLRLTRVAGVCWSQEKILLVRPRHSRWFQGLWVLPHEYLEASKEKADRLDRLLKRDFGLAVDRAEPLPTTNHGITHHRITTLAWQYWTRGRLKKNPILIAAKYFSPNDIKEIGLPNVDRKVLKAAGLWK